MGRVKEQLEEYFNHPPETSSASQLRYSKIEDEAPPSVLAEVILKLHKSPNGGLVRCIFLRFEDANLPERKMYSKFDPDGRILLKASALLGELVQTRVWRPEVYSPLEWFQDLYKVKSDIGLSNLAQHYSQLEYTEHQNNITMVNRVPVQRLVTNGNNKPMQKPTSPQPVANGIKDKKSNYLLKSAAIDTSNNAPSIQALLAKYPKRSRR